MLFTPEERRALLALTALLVLGQMVSFWEERKRSRPDRELSRWVERLARARGDSAGVARGSLATMSLPGVPLPLGLNAGNGAHPSSAGDSAVGLAANSAVNPAVESAADSTAVSLGTARTMRSVPVEGIDSVPPGILETGRVRINSAQASDLEGLPGVGPSIAARILAERERSGPFRKPEDLLRVKGIGPKTLSRFRDRIDCSLAPEADSS